MENKTGWIIAGIIMLIFYTITIFNWGISAGIKLRAQTFWIQNYNPTGYDDLRQGMNEIPNFSEKKETKKVERKKR